MDFEAIQTSIVAFVRQNQSWAPYIVAGLEFGESVAVLSLFVSATVILIAISAFIGVADLEFWPLGLGAVIGAATATRRCARSVLIYVNHMRAGA